MKQSLVSKHAKILLTRNMAKQHNRLKMIFGGVCLFADAEGQGWQFFVDSVLSRSVTSLARQELKAREGLRVHKLQSSPGRSREINFTIPYTDDDNIVYFDTLEELNIIKGKYYASTKKTLVAVDAFLVVGDYIVLIQSTIAQTHDIKANGIADLLAQVSKNQNLDRLAVRFLFVVPNEQCIPYRQPLVDYGKVTEQHKKDLLEMFVGGASGETLKQWRTVLKRIEFEKDTHATA
jgi:hypothetical protein